MSDRTGRPFEERISHRLREFVDPEEERAYLTDAWPNYARRLRTAVSFATGIASLGVLSAIFGVIDPGNVLVYVLSRSAVFAAFALLFLLSFGPHPTMWISRAVCLSICVAAIAWIVPKLAHDGPLAQGPGALMAALTLHLMLPVRYRHAMIAMAVLVAVILIELVAGEHSGPEIEFSFVILVITLISTRTVLQAKFSSRFRFFARRELNSAFHDLRLKELEVEQTVEQLRALITAMDHGVSVVNKDLLFIAWNPQFERLLELPQNFMQVGMHFTEVAKYLRSIGYFGQRDVDERRQHAIDAPRAGDHFELPLPGGRFIDVRRSGLPDGGIITSYTDITERKKAENLTRLLGMQDPLTRLANRALFLENLVAAIAEAERFRLQVGLLMIDLDHFKPVNDTYGHPVGDAVLQKVATILTGAVRDLDTVARLGGDEFAVVLTNLTWKDQADLPAKRILQALQDPMDIDGRTIRIGGSIGIAFYPDHGATPEALIAKADAALYAAKASGRNCVRRADDLVHAQSQRRDS